MKKYCTHVSGFFSRRDHAETVYSTFINNGIEKEQLTLRRADFTLDRNQTDDDGAYAILVSIMGAIISGIAVGTLIGVTAGLALNYANINLIAPLITPMIFIGWGASMGGCIGAVIGAKKKHQLLTQMTEDAILYKQFALIVTTRNRQQTSTVKSMMETAISSYKLLRDNATSVAQRRGD